MTDCSNLEDRYFRKPLERDLYRLAIGGRIGQGCYRDVYAWLPDGSLVAKIENGAKCFTNILEQDLWDRVRGTEFADWFAPVREISDNGIILLQDRVAPIQRENLPDRIPAFLTDTKPENWGWLNGRPVCIDYGIHLMCEHGMTKRMKKADWD